MINIDFDIANVNMCTGEIVSTAHYHNPTCPVGCVIGSAGLYVVQQTWDIGKCILGPLVVVSSCAGLCPQIPYYCRVVIQGLTGIYAALNGVWDAPYVEQGIDTVSHICFAGYQLRIVTNSGGHVIVTTIGVAYYFEDGIGIQHIDMTAEYDVDSGFGGICTFPWKITGTIGLIDCTSSTITTLTPQVPVGVDCVAAMAGAIATVQLQHGADICFPPPTCDHIPPPPPCVLALPASFTVDVYASGCFGGTLFSGINVPGDGFGLYQRLGLVFGGGLFKADIIITANLSGRMTLQISVQSVAFNPVTPCIFITADSNAQFCCTGTISCGPPLSWILTTRPVLGCADYLPPNANPDPSLQGITGDCALLNMCSGFITINIVGA